jgi:hypothetical protein
MLNKGASLELIKLGVRTSDATRTGVLFFSARDLLSFNPESRPSRSSW